MRKPITIAYLEDDQDQGSAVTTWLNAQSMQCEVFGSVDAMKAALATTAFDAIMLDVDIGGEPAGLSLLGFIRETNSKDTPILMVSTEAHWQEALASGADDFLEKPFNAKKLLVRVHRLLRPVAQEATIENYPPFQLNTTRHQIMLKGDCVDLSEGEYELASTLFRHFGKVLSYQQLVDKLSTERLNGSVHKIDSDLHKLKRKMNLSDADGWRLESVYRHGYRLVNAQYDPCLL